MNSSDPLFIRLSNAFTLCSDPKLQNRQLGEKEIAEISLDPQYPILLITYISNPDVKYEMQLRAALQLKNWCDKYKKLDDYDVQILQMVVNTIKDNIVGLVMSVPPKVSSQIQESIYLLSVRELPYRWPTLPQLIGQYIGSANPDFCLRALKTLKKIVNKYEYASRSDPLYEEIILVCDLVHDILLACFQNLLSQVENYHSIDPVMPLRLIKNLLKIFYCLNYQDLHPKFEENLNIWMAGLATVLRFSFPVKDDSLVFKCKGEALRSVLLYAMKYREDFEGLIQSFSEEIWKTCTTATEDLKFDKIILNALKYFKNLILFPAMRSFFEGNLSILMSSLIIPNMKVTRRDELLFCEEPQQFIDIYFDNSEINSRKSATIELMKNLSRHYTKPILDIYQGYLVQYAEQFKSSSQNLESELILINLLVDGVPTAFRPQDGATSIALPGETITYFYCNILKPYLLMVSESLSQGADVDSKVNSLHMSFYMRFLFYFRHFLDKGEILEIIRIISGFLATKSEGFRNVSCYTVNCLLSIKQGDLQNYINLTSYFNKDNIFPQIQTILQNIYMCSKANDISTYLLRALNTIIHTLKENVSIFTSAFSDLYKDLLTKLFKGSTFEFSLLIFEGIGALMSYTSKSKPTEIATIEGYLTTELNSVFSRNMTDVIGFVIQIFALIVEGSPGAVGQNYQILYDSILNSNNWIAENASIYPAYCLLIESFIKKNVMKIYENKSILQAFMTHMMFQLKLDQLFLNLSYSFINLINMDTLRESEWIHYISSSCFNYYANEKSAAGSQNQRQAQRSSFIKEFFLFLCSCLNKFNAKEFFIECEKVMPGYLVQFLTNEISVIKTVQKKSERGLIFSGISNFLFNQFDGSVSLDVWASLLNAIVENCILRRSPKSRFLRDTLGEPSSAFSNNVILGNNSGFQKLSVFNDSKKNMEILIADEEKYFGQLFKQFYSNPNVKSVLNISQLLPIASQEMLTKLFEESV